MRILRRTGNARATARAIGAVLAVALAAPVVGVAHAPTTGFSDSYGTLGPLPSGPADPYEIKAGTWTVVDRAIVDQQPLGEMPQAGTRRVLMQSSRAANPVEPIAFIRARMFRSFTAQVTAALIDDVPGGSVGMVFRAPVLEDGSTDGNNLYLFTAARTGIVGPFSTGQAFLLFKRVGRGYYLLNTKIANTWFKLTDPHEYKVVMNGGHIQAFVDGRLVIDHVDANAGDQPTPNDPFPGLPFDNGSVGLRTSVSRAWFDDFSVVSGPEGYEGRAAAVDAYTEHGANINGLRTGAAVQVSNLAKLGDTGFVYHDHDGYTDTAVGPLDPNETGNPTVGPTISTRGEDGASISTARLAGFKVTLTDPTKHIRVTLQGDGIEAVAAATCDGTTSAVDLDGVTITLELTNDGAQQVPAQRSEYTLGNGYPPDTVLYEIPGQISITAHATRRSGTTRRIEAAALKVSFPAPELKIGATNLGRAPLVEYSVAAVVAGRYCK